MKIDCGTTLEMMQPSRSFMLRPELSLAPPISNSWCSQTAYSSAVRMASVAVRHWAIHSLPS
ncbi:hypothetical protein D3C85_1862760 [compost metagenome]